jgi:hypothetical protein
VLNADHCFCSRNMCLGGLTNERTHPGPGSAGVNLTLPTPTAPQGLARQHHATTVMTGGIGAGTLPYMAPELLVTGRGGIVQHVTNRVDIYRSARRRCLGLPAEPCAPCASPPPSLPL